MFRLIATIYWKFAKHCATHHIHYLSCFSWKPYEVGIVSASYGKYNSFRKISHLSPTYSKGEAKPLHDLNLSQTPGQPDRDKTYLHV